MSGRLGRGGPSAAMMGQQEDQVVEGCMATADGKREHACMHTLFTCSPILKSRTGEHVG